MQSNSLATAYLTQIRTWLDSHPKEIVVIWVSKHGSACSTGNDQYPNVPVHVKQAFWQNILSIFSGIVVDVRKTPINTTSIQSLITKNTRVVFYATDYVEFTGSSSLALDGCLVDNQLCAGIDGGIADINCLLQNFQNSVKIRKDDARESRYFLQSMATSGPESVLLYMFLLEYADIDDKYFREKCGAGFSNIPGITDWCPNNLLDISQLQNYYNQLLLEFSLQKNYLFPNAIYLDALDIDGTIRTGMKIYEKFSGDHLRESRVNGDHDTVRYAYAYTVILSNLMNVCGSAPSPTCTSWISKLQTLRALYPLQRWDDAPNGRSSTWPFKM